MNDNEIRVFLINNGFKEKDALLLIRLAKRKNISIGRAFYLYAWKYYAWGGALLVSAIFSSANEKTGVVIFNFALCIAVALISLLFTPFVNNFFLEY